MTTTIKIGPTFAAELATAGLANLPFSWGADGTLGADALSPTQLAAVKTVLAAHNVTASLQSVAWDQLRASRDSRLSASDWTQLGDVPDSATKTEWQTYRQALRSLPANTTDPTNPTWPVAPA